MLLREKIAMDSDKREQKILFLEDLSVGMRFQTSTHTLDEGQIIRFAKEFDPQPFHSDAVAAKKTFFGELIASGWHTAAVTMKLLVTGECRLAGGLIGMGGEAVWPTPVRPGDTLRVESELIEIRLSQTRKNRAIVTLRSETLNQNNEIVQKLTAKLLVRSRND